MVDTLDGETRADGIPIHAADSQTTWMEPLAGYAVDGAGFGCEYFKTAQLAFAEGGVLSYTVKVDYGCSGSETDHDASTCDYAGQLSRSAGAADTVFAAPSIPGAGPQDRAGWAGQLAARL